ncbi:hypothetical protein [Nostoc sp. 106C]|uniref:hypothetical protein n=2 Tax=Nostoc sp. 106C TaxID=1932667 RepID=UPI001FB7BA96|nr:hypothetical protein [Nostoc sp. 106C]
MVQQMLRRLIQWLKKFFQSLFGAKPTRSQVRRDIPQEPPPQLSDTDLEFLFNELLEGVHQARGQAWAVKWLNNIEHRIPTERWVQWLGVLGERLLASPTPNNELATRLVQLGDLGVGEVGDVAYDIGMQLLTRNQGGEPIWEYAGPDAVKVSPPQESESLADAAQTEDNFSEEGYQTVTLEQLFAMMQEDETLCQQVAQQLGLETNDPQAIIQALINQYHAANQEATEQTES